MAGFKTHITVSTVVGVGVGVAGHVYGLSWETCVLGGGLCSVAGILPDLDSSSGVPFRESLAFLSAFVPLMLLRRVDQFQWTHETRILFAAMIYMAVRFGVGPFFRNYTVHRGMWHSIPAAASVGLLAFLICGSAEMETRLFWAGSVVVGFLTHLILDEIYSIDVHGVRLKKSFGTALKFYSMRGLWPNVSTYGKLAVLLMLAWGDPRLTEMIEQKGRDGFLRTARQQEVVPTQQEETQNPFFR